jgi:diamine N-acetyltransferase
MLKNIEHISLSPATPKDRKKIYNWLRNWNNGFVYEEIPSYSAMCEEKEDYFYNGSSPEKGMYFMIKSGNEDAGTISYTCFHLKPGVAEFDIWLKDESVCGKGIGYNAIKLLFKEVRNKLGIHTVLIRPSKKNLRAIHVYKKCGFSAMTADISAYMKPEFLDKYGPGDCGSEGTENMIKHFQQSF